MTKRELEVTDINEIAEILDRAKVLHLGLVDEGRPYIVTMNYGYEIDNGKPVLYLHSAEKAYKINVIMQNPDCCFRLECDVEAFEGPKPCMNGMSYRYIAGRGKAILIEGHEDREKAMNVLMKTQSGQEYEFSEKMLSALHMIRIDVDEFIAGKRPLPKDR
ncbi:MAG: pyridoxamine 5'-phosphate oxidase family protein [Bacillota bacterium]|nr:pyridoxamine 5'-phosphate oxidase family protein [Bacillota bacterium]